MEDIRIVLWGLGAMGSGMGRVLHSKEGVTLVGAADADPQKIGRDLGEVLGLTESLSIDVCEDGDALLTKVSGDVCLICTSSFVADVAPQIITALQAGFNVITIAEEMAYPAARDAQLTVEINRAAREAGKTVLGTGINPGFVLDTLIIALSGACIEVDHIVARRVNDLSPFGPTVMRTQGVGVTPEVFAAGLADGSIVGHVGFPESMGLIARAFGWELDRVEETREPIIASEERMGQHIQVQPGQVAGCNHTAVGYIGNRAVIHLEHPQQIQPLAAGVDTGDFIEIHGTPDIRMAIQPEIPGGLGTIALACNMVPAVLAAPAGLVTMAELPIPRALLGDVREIAARLKDPGDWRDPS